MEPGIVNNNNGIHAEVMKKENQVLGLWERSLH